MKCSITRADDIQQNKRGSKQASCYWKMRFCLLAEIPHTWHWAFNFISFSTLSSSARRNRENRHGPRFRNPVLLPVNGSHTIFQFFRKFNARSQDRAPSPQIGSQNFLSWKKNGQKFRGSLNSLENVNVAPSINAYQIKGKTILQT